MRARIAQPDMRSNASKLWPAHPQQPPLPIRVRLPPRCLDTGIHCICQIRSDRPYTLISLRRFLVKLLEGIKEYRRRMSRSWTEDRQRRVRHFLYEVACRGRDYPQAISLSNQDRRGRIVVAAIRGDPFRMRTGSPQALAGGSNNQDPPAPHEDDSIVPTPLRAVRHARLAQVADLNLG